MTRRIAYAFWAAQNIGTMWKSPRGLAVIADVVTRADRRSYEIRYKLFRDWGRDAWT